MFNTKSLIDGDGAPETGAFDFVLNGSKKLSLIYDCEFIANREQAIVKKRDIVCAKN